jgi:diguanylate cyclase (GGDEF)-like protein
MEQAMTRVGFFDEGQAVWWPTNGLALALLLRTQRRRWPSVIAGALLGSLTGELFYHFPLSTNLVNVIANSAGPLSAAFALPRFRKLDEWLREPRLVSRFIAFAILTAPLLSATIFAAGWQILFSRPNFWIVLQRRSVADMLGYTMFTPLVLVLSSPEIWRKVQPRALLKPALLVMLTVAVTFAVFGQGNYPLSFVLASVVLLVTLQLGFGASVVTINLLAAIVTSQTMHGHGPFTLGIGMALAPRILLLQSFLTLSMITVFSVSVIQLERDMNEKKLRTAYEQMEELAKVDSLTGLSNRRRLEEALEKEWARSYRTGDSVALLMIDADNFKSYNDSFGHTEGDECLRAIAGVARQSERRSTDLLARYGGEEFVFLLPTNDTEGAASIAESIRRKVEVIHEEQPGRLRRKVTVSIGCAAMVPSPGTYPKMLIDASDLALYCAKQAGRNRVETAKPEIATVRVDLGALDPDHVG